jgi:hypothetical protein
MDANKQVIIQTKFTVDDLEWSKAHPPFNTEAPRPGGREFAAGHSGVEWNDVRMAPTKVVTDTRLIEIDESVARVRSRLTGPEWDELQTVVEVLKTQQPACDLAGNHGYLLPRPDDDEKVGVDGEQLLMRPDTLWASQSAQSHARALRYERGHASTPLEVGSWVAYPVTYTDAMPEDKKQDFFVAKITQIDVDLCEVKLKPWNTTCVRNLTHTPNPTYKSYRTPAFWMTICDVLEVFKLSTKRNLIPEGYRHKIANALVLRATMLQAVEDGDIPVGVGADRLENPEPYDEDVHEDEDEDEDA